METSSNKGIILIADTQYLTTEALKLLLAESGHKIEAVSSRSALLQYLQQDQVALIITDYVLFDFRSINDLKEIGEHQPDSPILILSNAINQMQIKEFNNVGIRNIALKTDDKTELLLAVSSALKGKKAYSGSVLDILLKLEGPVEDACLLTSSEIEIVRLISSGLSTKEIATKKHISFHTVMTHRKNIFRKLGVSSSPELMMFAIKAGLIDNIEYHI
ncbi:MAG: response regulator transcription factor [Chlorobiaceae bacterium]|nr:response regulator transcription factor [Chlorobiaceae bacterium]